MIFGTEYSQVDERIARDGDEADGLFRPVDVHEHHGVGAVAALVRPGDEDGGGAGLARGQGVLRLRLAGDEEVERRGKDRQQKHQHGEDAQAGMALGLFLLFAAPARRGGERFLLLLPGLLLFGAQALGIEPFGVFRGVFAGFFVFFAGAGLPDAGGIVAAERLLALGAGEAFLLADALVFGAAGTLVGGLGLLVVGQRGLGLAGLFRAVEFAVVDLHVVGRDGLGVFRVRLRRGFRGDVGVGLAEKAFDVLQQCVDVVGGRFFRSALLLRTQLIEVFHKLSPSIFRPAGGSGGKKVSNLIRYCNMYSLKSKYCAVFARCNSGGSMIE